MEVLQKRCVQSGDQRLPAILQGASPELAGLVDKLPKYLQNPDPKIYLSDNYVVCDFETTILENGSPYERNNSIVCATWRLGPSHPAFTPDTQYHRGNEYDMARLVDAIQQADFWVAHNSKFEFGWLERCGLPLGESLAFCTMLAEYVLLANRSTPQRLSLENCLNRRGMPPKDKLGKSLLRAGVCPSQWPERWLKPYATQDSDAGESLFLHQRRALERRGMLGVAFTRNIFTPVLVDIERRGVHLDPERAPIIQRKYHQRLHEITDKLDKLTGGANPSSPKQMREVIFEKLKFPLPKDKRLYTPSGEVKTGAEVIDNLKPTNRKQRLFIKLKKEYSKVNGALTKCLNKFTDCINETEDHILTANMNQAITVTQRLSSTGRNYKAQFQNFPRDFKPLFSARHEGWLIGEIDQAQLEYRVAVYLGQDEAGLESILQRKDRHAITATQIFGDAFTRLPPKSMEWDEMRTDAKPDTFKPLYGGESGTKGQQRYYKAFKEEHKGITEAQTKWKISALNTGKVRIPSGLEFYFPGTRMMDDGYITNSTNICNYPVQSFATADIVPIGVTYQWHFMRVAELDSFIVNTVHDSAIGEVHPDEQEIYEEIGAVAHVECVYYYLKEVYDVDFNVPLETEAKFGTHWAEPKGWQERHLS